MAIGQRRYNSERLIHHSDRGIQYCCFEYVDLLQSEAVAISMTQSGNPYDNALAEQMNNTIKNDYKPNKIYQREDRKNSTKTKDIAVYSEESYSESSEVIKTKG